ncbi:MAG: transposase [Acidimicrobiia bacterium]
METMERERRPRRSFSKEFKRDTVELVRSSGMSIAEVGRDLDLTESAVREWVRQADIDEGRKEGLTTAEREELVRLRRENRVLRMEKEILGKAALDSTSQRNSNVKLLRRQGGKGWRGWAGQAYATTTSARCGIAGQRESRSARSAGPSVSHRDRSSRSCAIAAALCRRCGRVGRSS